MAVAVDIRVKATTQAGKFREGPLQLGPGWSTVNAARPDVRRALIDHAGVHVRVHPLDTVRLVEAGLVMMAGRLQQAPESATAPPPEPPPSAPARPARVVG